MKKIIQMLRLQRGINSRLLLRNLRNRGFIGISRHAPIQFLSSSSKLLNNHVLSKFTEKIDALAKDKSVGELTKKIDVLAKDETVKGLAGNVDTLAKDKTIKELVGKINTIIENIDDKNKDKKEQARRRYGNYSERAQIITPLAAIIAAIFAYMGYKDWHKDEKKIKALKRVGFGDVQYYANRSLSEQATFYQGTLKELVVIGRRCELIFPYQEDKKNIADVKEEYVISFPFINKINHIVDNNVSNYILREKLVELAENGKTIIIVATALSNDMEAFKKLKQAVDEENKGIMTRSITNNMTGKKIKLISLNKDDAFYLKGDIRDGGIMEGNDETIEAHISFFDALGQYKSSLPSHKAINVKCSGNFAKIYRDAVKKAISQSNTNDQSENLDAEQEKAPVPR